MARALPSIRLHGGLHPRRAVALAQAAEQAGFDTVWFAENPFNRGILPTAAACAVATTRIKIGAGVFNPYSRHPSAIAMDIGALDELADGRARLGMGSGIGSAIERMGFAYDRPLTTLREAIRIVRALLRGDTVTLAGEVFKLAKLKLDYQARGDIPIFMAARGDKSLCTAGELADGVILSNMCTRSFAARSVALIRSARGAAAGTAAFGVVQYLPCVVRSDPLEAMRIAKRQIAPMLPNYWRLGARLPDARAALIDGSGLTEGEIAGAAGRLEAGELAEQILDDRYVAAYAIAGTAADCRRQAAAYAAAGVTELALSFDGPDAEADIAAIGSTFRA